MILFKENLILAKDYYYAPITKAEAVVALPPVIMAVSEVGEVAMVPLENPPNPTNIEMAIAREV
jgi:hypothetical protein